MIWTVPANRRSRDDSRATQAQRFFDSNQNRGVHCQRRQRLYFDRNTSFFGKNYRQTLEPRLFYLYVPEVDQEDIPVFDTSENTFSYASLSVTTASRLRRVGDENKLSLGVTSR